MPIFKVKIAVKTTYYSSIIVEAENVNSALEYAKTMTNGKGRTWTMKVVIALKRSRVVHMK